MSGGSWSFPNGLGYLVVERLELAVRAHGVVVEHRELADLGCAGEGCGVGDARVPPAEPVRVLLVCVLRVVQKEVGTCCERPAGDPLGLVVERGGQVRLVIGYVGEHMALLLDPVAERGTTMLDRLRLDDRAADAPRLARHVFERRLGGSFREADREERWRQVSRDPLPERRRR